MTAGHTSSFVFLAPHGPLYLQLATVAESALALDPSLTLLKLRQLAEAVAQRAASAAGLREVGRDTNQHDLLRMLEQRGIVTDHIAEVFHMLRRAGNRAAHDFIGTHQDAVNALRIAYDLAGWFHRTFGDKHARAAWKAPPYVPPPDPAARLRSLEEAAASARSEADVYKYDVRKALKQLEAEEARVDMKDCCSIAVAAGAPRCKDVCIGGRCRCRYSAPARRWSSSALAASWRRETSSPSTPRTGPPERDYTDARTWQRVIGTPP